MKNDASKTFSIFKLHVTIIRVKCLEPGIPITPYNLHFKGFRSSVKWQQNGKRSLNRQFRKKSDQKDFENQKKFAKFV